MESEPEKTKNDDQVIADTANQARGNDLEQPADTEIGATSFDDLDGHKTRVVSTRDDGETKSAGVESKWLPSIPGYKVKYKLGQGGMGSVFLAVDGKLGREVAIKVVNLSFHFSKKIRQRFDAEIQTLATLQHDNIAQLYAAGQSNDMPYFVMEYVSGPTLEQFAPEPMRPSQAAKLVLELCDAVEFCHSKGVLHRDLKPANVLMTEKGRPKIADFGLAKVIGDDATDTKTGEVLGTPSYMAPEQASGERESVSESCDIYAIGSILYRLLSARPPFVASDSIKVLHMVLNDTPISPKSLVNGLPLDIVTICQKCLEKNPQHRYLSVTELKYDLDCFLNKLPIKARPVGFVGTTIKWAKRNPMTAALCCFVALTAAISVFALTLHNQQLSRQLERSRRLADGGSEFSNWVITDHLNQLNQISGTSELRKDIVERATGHLNSINDDMPDEAVYLCKLARSYAQLAGTLGLNHNTFGDIDGAKENYAKAIQLFDQAVSLDQSFLQDVRFEKIDAMISLSILNRELSDFSTSDKLIDEARDLLDEVTEESNKREYLRLLIKQFEFDRAFSNNDFEVSARVVDEIDVSIKKLNNEEFDQVELAHQQIVLIRNRLRLQQALGNVDEAKKQLEFLVDNTRGRYLANPHSPGVSTQFASALGDLGQIQLEEDERLQSKQNFSKSLEIYEELARRDSNSVEAALNHASGLSRLAGWHQNYEEFERAKELIEQSIEIHDGFDETVGNSMFALQNLTIYVQSRASILTRLSKFEEAIESYDAHAEICHEILKTDPDSIFAINQLAESNFGHVVLVFEKWLKRENLAERVIGSRTYEKMIALLDNSIKQYARIESMAPLSEGQQFIREQAMTMKAMIVEMAKKLDSLSEEPDDL